jgi:hypothetical protein
MENSEVIKKFRLKDLKKKRNLKKLQNIKNEKKNDDYDESINLTSHEVGLKNYSSLFFSYISSFRLIKSLISNNKYLRNYYKNDRNKIKSKKKDLEGGTVVDPGMSPLEGLIPEVTNQSPEESKVNDFVKNNDSDEDGDNEYDNDGYQSSSSISSQSSLSSDDSDIIVINSPLFPVWLTTLDTNKINIYLKIFFIYIMKNIRDKIVLNILNKINALLIYIMMKIDGKNANIKIDSTDDISQEIEIELLNDDTRNQINKDNQNHHSVRNNNHVNDTNGNNNHNNNDQYYDNNDLGRKNYNYNNMSDDSQENA